jgi:hypothetical protein
MQDFARQAKEALSVYLARGNAALECLRAGNFDEASDLLRKRNAAFHNFRAQDALALAEGQDLTLTEEAQSLWQDIRAVEKALSSLMSLEREKAGALYQRIREARQKIIRYHSGNPDHPRFEKTA